MASLFSSRCLLRHTRPLLQPIRTRYNPPPLLLRLLHTSSPLRFPPTRQPLPLPKGAPAAFSLVHRSAIGKETPLYLAGADQMELPAPAMSLEVGEKKSVSSLTDQTKEFGENSYSCDCMSWTFQKKRAVDVRSCKHLREILGDEHEDARTGDSGRSSGKATAKKAAGSSASASTSTSTSTSTFESPRTYAEPGSKKRPVAVPGQGGLKAKKAKTAAAEHDREDEGEQAGLTDPEEETDVAEGQKKGKKNAERKGGIELLLAQKFDLEGKKDPKGWWISEKLDGVRAYWDGQSALYSRTGNPFVAPPAFVAHLPKGVTLDGELFLGRDRFDETSGIVRTTTGTGNGAGKGGWGEIRYMIFDIPSLADQPFEQRLAAMNRLFPTAPAFRRRISLY
ncbi:hypothetical protein JCM11641_003815 [Rhodosporidiobolus odoratus]